jgi:hypothetical protein
VRDKVSMSSIYTAKILVETPMLAKILLETPMLRYYWKLQCWLRYYWKLQCYCHVRHSNPPTNSTFTYGKRLYQEWVVDQYCKVEGQRLRWVRLNHTTLHANQYKRMVDAM